MTRLRLLGVPIAVALRRMRERPLTTAAGTLAAAGAAALIGWSSLTAALAQENSVRLRLGEVSASTRSLQAVAFVQPLEPPNAHAEAVDAFLDPFADETTPRHRIRIWSPVAPADERGTRLVVPSRLSDDVHVATGRLPRSCRDGACEALALAGAFGLGQEVRLGKNVTVRIVGRGTVRRDVLPTTIQPWSSDDKTLLVRSIDRKTRRLLSTSGSVVIDTAALDPDAVHAAGLRRLERRLRNDAALVERNDPSVDAGTPAVLLATVARRGEIARDRLLLVAAQGAALIVAFAAFAAAARRRETSLLDDQLAVLGASRSQAFGVRLFEALSTTLAGVSVAIAGLRLAIEVVARRRDLTGNFVSAALPRNALLTILAVGAVAVVLTLLAASTRRSRRGVGAIEVAALTALAVVVWQAATTGALDPDRLARRGAGSPILLLLPGLTFFAAAVLLVRLLPAALRLAERLTRRAPFGLRLAFLSAARNPAQAAAATTFLAVALGSALFSLNYAATLDRQARDEASFTAGARWRVLERSSSSTFGPPDVTPLTRFRRVSAERPSPVIRLRARVKDPSAPAGVEPQAQLVAIPAARVTDLRGWRASFSGVSRGEIAKRLRPRPVVLHGPALAPDARAIRVWARSLTKFPRKAIAYFLLPGEQRIEFVRLGDVWKRWTLLHANLPPSLRGSQLVGLEFLPTVVPIGRALDLSGVIQIGRLQQRSHGSWAAFASPAAWTPAMPIRFGGPGEIIGGPGFIGSEPTFLGSEAMEQGAPVARATEFHLYGTERPLIRPALRLPKAVPAVVSPSVAAHAVYRVLILDVDGRPLPVRVVATSRRLPTVTSRADSFVAVDYDTLFAVLNAEQPGSATLPNEAWFFGRQRSDFAPRLAQPPFRLQRAVGADALRKRLLDDPLAAGTRDVLEVSTLAAALLALLGLALAVRSALSSERPLLGEYEALGVPPRTLVRVTQVRLLAVSFVGIAAAVLGGLLALRLIGAFVAVTGTASRPLLAIESVVAWKGGMIVLAAVGVATVAIVAALAGRALREPAARRLRL